MSNPRTPSSSVQVLVRLRPMNENEMEHSTLPVIKASTLDKSVTVIKGQGSRQARNTFKFDSVFTGFSTQEEVFTSVQPMINDVMSGFEATIFAYGQTGTGKTYTMEGNLNSADDYGVIPRAAQSIFEALRKPEYTSARVSCSYLEIYNEELGDLLADDSIQNGNSNLPEPSSSRAKKGKLEIMEGNNGPFCRGLTEKVVQNASDVLNLMQGAQERRKVGETKMNKASSRSHCIFTIKINAVRRLPDGSSFDFNGKLHMVDLAGSEGAKKANIDGSAVSDQLSRERERMNINRSLLTLGRVIKILKEQSEGKSKKSERIPYRDSKLTRILQESLGGRCKTIVVATLSPSITAIEESMSTLNYAQSASGIVNKPVSSSLLSFSSTVSTSESTINNSEPSVEHWQEMECRLEYMTSQVEEAQAALARKHLQQQELIDRAEEAEVKLSEKENELFEANQVNVKLTNELSVERESHEKTLCALQKTQAILKATQHTEECLTKEAYSILKSLEDSIRDGDSLYNLLNEAREDIISKRFATRGFRDKTVSILESVRSHLNQLDSLETSSRSALQELSKNGMTRENTVLNDTINVIQEIRSQVESLLQTTRSHVESENGAMALLSSLSENVSKNTTMTVSKINDGEKVLDQNLAQTKESLLELGNNMKTFDDDFRASSSEALSLIKKKLKESKRKLGDLTKNASSSLKEIQTALHSSSCNIQGILQDIQGASKSTSESVASLSAKGEHDALSISNHLCESIHSNLQKIDELLLDQGNVLVQDGVAHQNEIQKLKDMLETQKQMYVEAEKKQKDLQATFMKSIFKGLKMLVEKEMSELANSNESQFKEFNNINQDIHNVNEGIASSATLILDKFSGSKDNVQLNVNEVAVHVKGVEENSSSIMSTFRDISQQTMNHNNEVTSCIQRGETELGEISTIKSSLQDVNDCLNTSSKELNAFIGDDVLKETKTTLESMNDCESKMFNFVSGTILPNVKEQLDEVKAPRSALNDSILTSINEVASIVDQSSSAIHDTLKKQIDRSSSIADNVVTRCAKFVSDSETVRINIKEHQQSLESATKMHIDAASKLIVTASSAVDAINNEVQDFANSKISCEDDVPVIAKRTRIDYNSNFTSTPAPEVIVKDLNLSKTIVASEVNETVEDSDVSTRTESPIENKSMSSIEAPVESEKENNGRPPKMKSKQNKHKRSHSRSRVETPVRKRMNTSALNNERDL